MSNHQRASDKLCQAASAGNLTEVQQLLADGVDPNGKDAFGDTALMSTEDVAIGQALLMAGADVQAVDKYGDDVLAHTLEEHRLELAQWLVQAGADLNRRDEHSWTRLRKAAFSP